MEQEYFRCNNKALSSYLIKHGSKFIGTDVVENTYVYVFVKDAALEANLIAYATDLNLCMF